MQKESGSDLVPMKEDEDMGRGLQLTSCVSKLNAGAQGESQAPDISPGVVEDETDGGERKSFSAKDLPQLNMYVVFHMFQFMKPVDILKASQTCRLWRAWGENEKVWELKCMEAGLAYSLTAADLRALERRNKKSIIAYSAWKVNFLKLCKIAKNLREGNPQMLTIEINNDVLHLEFSNDKIVTVSGSRPSYTDIRIFCALSGNLLHELVGHTMQVTAIQLDEEFVVSSSLDGSIKVWDVETGACHTLIDDHMRILCLKMHGHIAVSGSSDHTVRMWNIREERHLRTLTGHTKAVEYVQFDGSFVVSGSNDYTIKIWDAGTGECVRTLNVDTIINSLEFNGADVLVGIVDGSFDVWNVESGVRRYQLEGNNNFFYTEMEMEGNLMVCRGVDDETTADIWDISAGVRRLHTLAGPHKHNDAIRGFQVSGKFVLTSTEDETVKLWDVKTGEFVRDLVLGSGLKLEKAIDCQLFARVDPTIIRMKNAKIVGAVCSSTRSQILVLNFDPNDDEN